MAATIGTARRLLVGLVVAALLLALPPGWQNLGVLVAGAIAPDPCTRTGEIRATTCRLTPGEAIDDTLSPGEPAVYRLDVLTPNSHLDLVLTGDPGTTVSVLNWRGDEISSATHTDADTHLTTIFDLPGVYGVRVTASDPSSSPPFHLEPRLLGTWESTTVVWPRSQVADADSLAGERQLLRTPRGGTPSGGVAIAQALGAPPAAEVSDFTLVADVHIDQVTGPAGLTVRFRYEPEAGGGSGYLLTLDPFAGESYLDSFEEGRRRPVVGRTKLPVELADGTPRRLVLQAAGPDLTASLDGQELLRASDTRYPGGLIAIGAVTWSDPVGVIFDHLLVLTPSS
jgi:hypothetical protein